MQRTLQSGSYAGCTVCGSGGKVYHRAGAAKPIMAQSRITGRTMRAARRSASTSVRPSATSLIITGKQGSFSMVIILRKIFEDIYFLVGENPPGINSYIWRNMKNSFKK
jgi:hypothetical protein